MFTFVPASREAHPKARFWDQSDWTAFAKGEVGQTALVNIDDGEVPKPSGTDWRYMTDENGQPVSKSERTALRTTCMQVFHKMDIEWDPTNPIQQRDPPPSTWARMASSYYSDFLRNELEKKHSWVKLCSHAWKSRQIGIDYFPQYRVHSKAPTANALYASPHVKKLEEADSEDLLGSGSEVRARGKRSASPSTPAPMAKRTQTSIESQTKAKNPL